jgi:hypothetical protein
LRSSIKLAAFETFRARLFLPQHTPPHLTLTQSGATPH